MSATITDPRFMHLIEKALAHEKKRQSEPEKVKRTTVHKMPTATAQEARDRYEELARIARKQQQLAELARQQDIGAAITFGQPPAGASILGPAPSTHSPALYPSTHIVPDYGALIPKLAPEVEARFREYDQKIADLQTQVDQLTTLFNTLAPMIAAPLNEDTKKGEAA